MILIALSVILAAFVLRSLERRYPTYQDILDGGRDQDGDGFPEYFPQFDATPSIVIEDTIRSLHYVNETFPEIVVGFPYKDGKWPAYAATGEAPALVFDDLGAYDIGSTVRLSGTIQQENSTSGNHTYQSIIWQLPAGTSPPNPPIVSMNETVISGVQHAVRIGGTTRAVALVHFTFFLFQGAQLVDEMHFDNSVTPLLMQLDDRGTHGVLDPGDVVLFHALQMSSYTLVLNYGYREVGRISFVQG